MLSVNPNTLDILLTCHKNPGLFISCSFKVHFLLLNIFCYFLGHKILHLPHQTHSQIKDIIDLVDLLTFQLKTLYHYEAFNISFVEQYVPPIYGVNRLHKVDGFSTHSLTMLLHISYKLSDNITDINNPIS